MKKICQNCQCRFILRPQNPDQKFCSKKICQRARKSLWQKNKLQNDADYQTNQQKAHQQWLKNNPDYWKNWRQQHPEYVLNNRQKQKVRNQKIPIHRQNYIALQNPVAKVPKNLIAKMDACESINHLLTGTYSISVVTDVLDCKDGLVNSGNLFKIIKIDTFSTELQR